MNRPNIAKSAIFWFWSLLFFQMIPTSEYFMIAESVVKCLCRDHKTSPRTSIYCWYYWILWTFETFGLIHYMGRAKRKCSFELVQNAQIQVHPTHAKSLIRAFALHWYILLCPIIMLADGPDQTARMHRLVWVFAVRICPKIRFRKVDYR